MQEKRRWVLVTVDMRKKMDVMREIYNSSKRWLQVVNVGRAILDKILQKKEIKMVWERKRIENTRKKDKKNKYWSY